MTGQAEDVLRAHCRAALRNAGISQAEACRQLDVSTKHMCQMLTGKAFLTLGWAERILALCGARLVIDVQPAPTYPITTHAYEGEGPGHACTARGYGTACGTPWEDHHSTEEAQQ